MRFHETHFRIRSFLVYCSPSLRHGLRHRTRHRSRSAAQACTRRHRHPQGPDFQLRANCTNRCKRRISLRRGSTWRISRYSLRRFLRQRGANHRCALRHGSYVVHAQLHVRGGHQVTWLIDGVAIPNPNIASNLGPQLDPKDIDILEAQRGSYSADYGDRTYGIFNVAPRTGFERDNEAELVLSAGNFYQTDDQLNFGGHTNRFAYYASVNGNRTNLGLQTPTSV